MAELTRGLLDTSVVIDHDVIDPKLLPDESAIASVTLAELAAGPHATDNIDERARRQDRLQWATATWDPLAFDDEGARVYGRLFAAARAAGQSSRSRFKGNCQSHRAVINSELPGGIGSPGDHNLTFPHRQPPIVAGDDDLQWNMEFRLS